MEVQRVKIKKSMLKVFLLSKTENISSIRFIYIVYPDLYIQLGSGSESGSSSSFFPNTDPDPTITESGSTTSLLAVKI